MLVIGVSYLVVPMFQLTPSYPVWLTRLLPAGLFLVLCLWSLQLFAPEAAAQAWQSGVALAGVLLAGLYAVATLWLQSRRRRRQTDVTLMFWRGAMLSLARFRLVLDRVRGAAAVGRRTARAAVAGRPGPARAVPLGDHGHALQDHALSQLAAPAAAGRNGHDARPT